MNRADLLALTPDSLAALTNRGLVKRAEKDFAAGAGPAISTDPDDGTIHAVYPDGVQVSLTGEQPLDRARCSCPAQNLCRHVVGLVLAYQNAAGATLPASGPLPRDDSSPSAAEMPVPSAWSPGDFTDETLEHHFGTRVVTAAQRRWRAGFTARIRRPTSADPVPTVELAACTVRFLVPGELAYVTSDAARQVTDEAVVLAVWAFREADRRDTGAPVVNLDVGGPSATGTTISGLEAALAVSDDLLLDGVVHATATSIGLLHRVRRDLDAANLRWPVVTVDELINQVDAYHRRSARHHAHRVAELIAELHARHRCVANGGASLRSQVLGTEEAAETPLRRVRLESLGCRITGTDDDRTAEVFLAHAGSGTVLVLRRSWELSGDERPTGHDLAGRRLSGATLAALATGNLVTESAVRSASRALRVASNRVARSTISPSTGGWEGLPEGLLVQDFARLAADLESAPPWPVRPRIEAERMRVLKLGEVVDIGYRPGDQELHATVTDRLGATALVRAAYSAVTPGALDSLAGALASQPRFVSGTVRRTRGTIVIEPAAVVTAAGLIVPDLAPDEGDTPLDLASPFPEDPVTAALDEAIALLADAAHVGLLHVPTTFADRLRRSAVELRRVGLIQAGALIEGLAAQVSGQRNGAAVQTWVDAELRLLVTADAR
jgi:hypothetical protein